MLFLGAVIVGCLLLIVYFLIRTQNKPTLETSLTMPEPTPPAKENAKAKPATTA